jgi:sulfur carrier protein ThiS
MIIKVGQFPGGKIKRVSLNDGSTVADALKAAELSAQGMEIRVNSSVTEEFNMVLSDGASVFLTKKIKGNADYDSIEIAVLNIHDLKGTEEEVELAKESQYFEKGTTVREALEALDIDTSDICELVLVDINVKKE